MKLYPITGSPLRKSAGFDSVYVSFYKGIGGIAGAILAENERFIEQSKVWKRRHGGQQRIGKMEQYHADARELAGLFNPCAGVVTVPAEPVSNMFHVHLELTKEAAEPLLIGIYEATGIGITS